MKYNNGQQFVVFKQKIKLKPNTMTSPKLLFLHHAICLYSCFYTTFQTHFKFKATIES